MTARGSRRPSLRVERALQRDGYRLLAGMDEVGRGALAGPVTVGVVLIDESVRSAPTGVRDSKLLAPAARRALVPRIQRWSIGYAVGHASAAEIDQVNAKLTRPCQVRKFTIMPTTLTVEMGELTPTLKVKRKVVMERQRALIDAMYADGGN